MQPVKVAADVCLRHNVRNSMKVDSDPRLLKIVESSLSVIDLDF